MRSLFPTTKPKRKATPGKSAAMVAPQSILMSMMSPDETPPQVQASSEKPALPARPPSPAAERNRRRSRLLAAQDFLQKASLENPRVKYRYALGFQEGTLHPSIEKALLDIAWGGPAQIDKRLAAALGHGHGLTLLLRKALNVDPLTEAKQIEATVTIEQPPQEPVVPAALPSRRSIVPPARPKRVEGKGTLRPGEEELA